MDCSSQTWIPQEVSCSSPSRFKTNQSTFMNPTLTSSILSLTSTLINTNLKVLFKLLMSQSTSNCLDLTSINLQSRMITNWLKKKKFTSMINLQDKHLTNWLRKWSMSNLKLIFTKLKVRKNEMLLKFTQIIMESLRLLKFTHLYLKSSFSLLVNQLKILNDKKHSWCLNTTTLKWSTETIETTIHSFTTGSRSISFESTTLKEIHLKSLQF